MRTAMQKLLDIKPGRSANFEGSSKPPALRVLVSRINTVRRHHAIPMMLRVCEVGGLVVRCEKVEVRS